VVVVAACVVVWCLFGLVVKCLCVCLCVCCWLFVCVFACWWWHSHITMFNENVYPPERVVVLRHLAGDAADAKYVTCSNASARGIKECHVPN